MRKIDTLILHCSATPEGRDVSVDDIKRMHTLPVSKGGRGWSDIGYHYVIHLDGSVHRGRSLDKIGAHCQGHNTGSIGICYVGGVDKAMNPKDTRTAEQKNALLHLVEDLLNDLHLGINNVRCHNEFANKACPSFKIDSFRKEYNNYINGIK